MDYRCFARRSAYALAAFASTGCAGSNQEARPISTEAAPAVGSTVTQPQSLMPGGPTVMAPRGALEKAYKANKGTRGGKNADYIPALAKVDSNLFGIAMVMVNGETMEIGDTNHPFAIESVSKVFTLARVLEDIGAKEVQKEIGTSATGMPFNSIIAIEINKKHPADNPFVNPGAIAAVSLVPAKSPKERWDKIIGTMNAFAGHPLTVNEEVYRSESATNARNRAIAWLLKSYDTVKGDPNEVLDSYTRQCSVSVTAKDLAVMGATLANGGVSPTTGQRLLSRENAAHILSVMSTTGLYDASGDWAYQVGVPAKSGVGGGIVAVVPGKYAVATFAPPLDDAGNSVRGQRAIESIVKDTGGGVFTSNPVHTK